MRCARQVQAQLQQHFPPRLDLPEAHSLRVRPASSHTLAFQISTRDTQSSRIASKLMKTHGGVPLYPELPGASIFRSVHSAAG